jgi:pimeloyl-ACP methyl ester carboxylesterase
MPAFTKAAARYPDGGLVVYSSSPWHGPPRPVVVLIHGALRWSETLSDWGDDLADIADLALIDLPGHGRSDPVFPASVEVMADRIGQAVMAGLANRQVLLVGESLGGLLALTIAGLADRGPVRAVLAADPPLTTRKLRNVHANLTKYVRDNPEAATFTKSLAFEVFGMSGQTIEERIYYPVIGRLKVPAMIVTGDQALYPRHERSAVACLVDDLDRFVLGEFYADKVAVRQIKDADHRLLTHSKPQCLALIKEMLAQVAASDRPAAG